MSTSPDELPISDARDRFTELLSQAQYTGQITYITKRGRRVGAIVPTEVADAAEAAEDAYLTQLAKEAEADLAAGGGTRPLGEVLAELGIAERDSYAPAPPQPRRGSAAEPGATAAPGGGHQQRR